MFAIEKLSRAEKLRMMEALWRDLSANTAELAPSAWHVQARQQAETALADGSARMVDWTKAKENLRQRAQSRKFASFRSPSKTLMPGGSFMKTSKPGWVNIFWIHCFPT